jgi:hypothetical protein
MADEAAITSLSDDGILLIFRQLGATCSATLARCCCRFADIFHDPLLWRFYLVTELALPPNVQVEGDARYLYCFQGACLILLRSLGPVLLSALHDFRPPVLCRCTAPLPDKLRCHPEYRSSFAIDGLSVSVRKHEGRALAVSADAPLPIHQAGVPALRHSPDGGTVLRMSQSFYFEVTFLSTPGTLPGDSSSALGPGSEPLRAAVGLSLGHFFLVGQLPGVPVLDFIAKDDDTQSLGYHSDGGFYHKGGSFPDFGPPFGPGDTVGCGVHLCTLSMFFTLNGTIIGMPCVISDALRERGVPVFITVGLDSPARIRLNFGRDEPFRYDPDTSFPPRMFSSSA